MEWKFAISVPIRQYDIPPLAIWQCPLLQSHAPAIIPTIDTIQQSIVDKTKKIQQISMGECSNWQSRCVKKMREKQYGSIVHYQVTRTNLHLFVLQTSSGGFMMNFFGISLHCELCRHDDDDDDERCAAVKWKESCTIIYVLLYWYLVATTTTAAKLFGPMPTATSNDEQHITTEINDIFQIPIRPFAAKKIGRIRWFVRRSCQAGLNETRIHQIHGNCSICKLQTSREHHQAATSYIYKYI